MKTLSHLQNEAIERFEKEFIIVQARNKGGAKFQPVLYYKNDMQFNLDGIKNFLKTELENIVKESFKNTRVEEKEMLDYDEQSIWTINQTRQLYNSALSDKHNKECEFLGK